ncbi:uncharacterized protein METZ01_LOCUS95258 [marine metagenome]|uniref:Uncharacterized protein n=1 Tax=marine metagenome TaxID=408172 RepID=A0A381VQA8_9ZZZZ
MKKLGAEGESRTRTSVTSTGFEIDEVVR